MINKIKITLVVSVIGIMMALALYTFLAQPIKAERMNRFETIPEKPNDFDAYMREIWSGTFVDLCEVPKEYYLQPAFYGNSWTISKQRFYDNPDYSKWGVYGHGNIPREMGFEFGNFKKGDEYEVCTFFHNGFGIWTYQGFELKAESDVFDIEITPNILTMSPTFPVFEEGWAKRITIKLKAKENIEKGTYVIGLQALPPPQSYSREEVKRILQFEVDKDKYKQECYEFYDDEEKCNYLINMREKKYVEGGAYQTAEPPLRLVINVI